MSRPPFSDLSLSKFTQSLQIRQMPGFHQAGRPHRIVRKPQPDEIRIVAERAVADIPIKRHTADREHHRRSQQQRLVELYTAALRRNILQQSLFGSKIFVPSNPIQPHKIGTKKSPFQALLISSHMNAYRPPSPPA